MYLIVCGSPKIVNNDATATKEVYPLDSLAHMLVGSFLWLLTKMRESPNLATIGWRTIGTLTEDTPNVTKAAVEEGFVGDGYTLLRLASKVDSMIESLENDKQQVGTEIVRKTLNYPFKFIVNKISRAMAGSSLAT